MQKLDTVIQQLRESTVGHWRLEETMYFPALRHALSGQELDDLWDAVTSLQRSGTLPTHPHPHGPVSAVGAKLVDPIVAVADKVKDALCGQPTAGQPS